MTISGDYQYIGLRSNDGALYVSSITISWDASGSSEGGSDPMKLAAPSVKCTARTETSLTFSWDAVANASGYQVSTDEGSTYGSTQTETTYTWTGLTASTSYTLYVKAIGDGTDFTNSDAASAEGKTNAGSGSGAGDTENTVEKTSGLQASTTATAMDSYISYKNSAANNYSDPMRIYQDATFTISATYSPSGIIVTCCVSSTSLKFTRGIFTLLFCILLLTYSNHYPLGIRLLN